MQLYTEGMLTLSKAGVPALDYYMGVDDDYGAQTGDEHTLQSNVACNTVAVPQVNIELSPIQISLLNNLPTINEHEDDFGIQTYNNVVDIIS